MGKKKGLGGVIAAAVIATGMVAGTIAAGVILPNANYVSVSCYANNGAPVLEQRVRKNSIADLPTPERAGCNFAGWYLDEDMTDAVTYNTKFNKSTKVYAGWEVEDYNVASLAEAAGITKIGAGAFKNCENLTNVKIPATVTSIGEGAFAGCNITNLYIENELYNSATSAAALGGALAVSKNVYVNETVEQNFYNDYFIESTNFYYAGKSDGYTHFSNDPNDEKMIIVTTETYGSETGTSTQEKRYRSRGDFYIGPRYSTTATGVFRYAGPFNIRYGETENQSTWAIFDEVTEDITIYEAKVKMSFDLCPWAFISEASSKGYQAGCFSIGEEKTITLTDGTSLTLQIADFNHDKDANGKTLGITIVAKGTIGSERVMNSSATNVGGWKDSAMRTYVNETIFAMLPKELQNWMKTTVKKSMKGGTSTECNETNDRIFLLSEAEIGLNTAATGYKDEGTPYQLFLNSESNRNISKDYWLRSPNPYESNSFSYVRFTGDISGQFAYYSSGVRIAFCI